jgi:hypothetical protein
VCVGRPVRLSRQPVRGKFLLINPEKEKTADLTAVHNYAAWTLSKANFLHGARVCTIKRVLLDLLCSRDLAVNRAVLAIWLFMSHMLRLQGPDSSFFVYSV